MYANQRKVYGDMKSNYYELFNDLNLNEREKICQKNASQ